MDLAVPSSPCIVTEIRRERNLRPTDKLRALPHAARAKSSITSPRFVLAALVGSLLSATIHAQVLNGNFSSGLASWSPFDEVDGAHASELLFTPAIDRDIHALFLKQIADPDPAALHIAIQDQAGFHLPEADRRLRANLRLSPYCPELNPVERFGGLFKAQVRNRLYPNLRKLEDHLAAPSRPWTSPDKVSGPSTLVRRSSKLWCSSLQCNT